MRDFKKLAVWEKAHICTLNVYKISAQFPREELFGLTGQLRRASASIPANIAEGCGRQTDPDMVRFLHIALGSANEVEYYLLLARDLQLIDSSIYIQLEAQIQEIQRMLASLIKRLSSK